MKKFKLEGEKNNEKLDNVPFLIGLSFETPKGRIFPCHSSPSFDSLSFDNLAETEIFAQKSFQDGRRVRRWGLSLELFNSSFFFFFFFSRLP